MTPEKEEILRLTTALAQSEKRADDAEKAALQNAYQGGIAWRRYMTCHSTLENLIADYEQRALVGSPGPQDAAAEGSPLAEAKLVIASQEADGDDFLNLEYFVRDRRQKRAHTYLPGDVVDFSFDVTRAESLALGLVKRAIGLAFAAMRHAVERDGGGVVDVRQKVSVLTDEAYAEVFRKESGALDPGLTRARVGRTALTLMAVAEDVQVSVASAEADHLAYVMAQQMFAPKGGSDFRENGR